MVQVTSPYMPSSLTEWTGNDAGTVVKYLGQKPLESFSVYLKPADKGRILATQAMSNVDGILTAQGGVEGVRSDGSAKKHARK